MVAITAAFGPLDAAAQRRLKARVSDRFAAPTKISSFEHAPTCAACTSMDPVADSSRRSPNESTHDVSAGHVAEVLPAAKLERPAPVEQSSPGGGAAREVASRLNIVSLVSGRFTLARVAWGLVSAVCTALIMFSMAYGVAYVLAGAFPAAVEPDVFDITAEAFGMFRQFVIDVRDNFGLFVTGGATPNPHPLAALGIGLTALAVREGGRAVLGIDSDGEDCAVEPSRGRPDDVAVVVGAEESGEQRVAAVRAVVEQLDAEWYSYETDLEAWLWARPALRDETVAQTAAYRAALYELRDRADALTPDSSAEDLDAADQAAEVALLAWGAANDHAMAVGISDRSPTERAALKRLHALTGQLADPSTPEAMCQNLIEAITREMDKLKYSTARVSWEHLSRVPALKNRNPTAIGQRDAIPSDVPAEINGAPPVNDGTEIRFVGSSIRERMDS